MHIVLAVTSIVTELQERFKIKSRDTVTLLVHFRNVLSRIGAARSHVETRQANLAPVTSARSEQQKEYCETQRYASYHGRFDFWCHQHVLFVLCAADQACAAAWAALRVLSQTVLRKGTWVGYVNVQLLALGLVLY